jgi:hypothetical protein
MVSDNSAMMCRFGKAFELTLLYQSLAVIGCQLALLSLCVRVRNSKLHTAIRKRFTDYDWSFFWNWSDFESYIQLLLCLACGLFVLGTAFGGSPLYVETLGAIALGIESTPALPQAYKNHVSKSTDGLKYVDCCVFLRMLRDVLCDCYTSQHAFGDWLVCRRRVQNGVLRLDGGPDTVSCQWIVSSAHRRVRTPADVRPVPCTAIESVVPKNCTVTTALFRKQKKTRTVLHKSIPQNKRRGVFKLGGRLGPPRGCEPRMVASPETGTAPLVTIYHAAV